MQLFKNDNHEELCSNMEIYLRNIEWKKQDTELYLYFSYNVLKMYAYSQKLLCCCCCRLIVEHYFLKFFECSQWKCDYKLFSNTTIKNLQRI